MYTRGHFDRPDWFSTNVGGLKFHWKWWFRPNVAQIPKPCVFLRADRCLLSARQNAAGTAKIAQNRSTCSPVSKDGVPDVTPNMLTPKWIVSLPVLSCKKGWQFTQFNRPPSQLGTGAVWPYMIGGRAPGWDGPSKLHRALVGPM